MSVLPTVLLMFAAGATLLQWQPELPAIEPWLVGAVVGVACAAIIGLVTRRAQPLWRTFAQVAVALLLAAAAAAFGFGYAAWRAQVRLADELPAQWEGVDVRLVGVIDELPQTSVRGTRFAFAV